MNKKAIMLVFALFASLSFVSAVYYNYGGYNNGQYDSYSSHTTRSQGYLNGPSYTSSADYNKYSSSRMLPDGSYQTTTQYVKTNTETPRYPAYPNYNTNYYPTNYQQNYQNYPANFIPTNYNNYNTNYLGYSNYNYGNYNNYYSDYPPWYQKYWNSNNRGDYMMNSYRPMYYIGYSW